MILILAEIPFVLHRSLKEFKTRALNDLITDAAVLVYLVFGDDDTDMGRFMFDYPSHVCIVYPYYAGPRMR